MTKYMSLFMLAAILLSLSPRVEGVVPKDRAKKVQHLQRTLKFHQRFHKSAQLCGVLAKGHAEALAEYRQAVQVAKDAILTKKPAEEITAALADADAKLLALEATVRREGRAITLLEQAGMARSVLPLVKDESARTKFTTLLDAFQADVKTLFAEGATLETFDKNLTTLYNRLRTVQKDIYAVTGWQPGVSDVSFGRFGWKLTDGLLCDTVAFESLQTTAEQKQLGRTAYEDRMISTLGCDLSFPEVNATLSIGPAGVPKIHARMTGLNWIGKTLTLDSPHKKNIGTVYTTLHRPATRFHFSIPAVTCPVRKFAPAESSVRYVTSQGWKTVSFSSKSSIPGSQMERPWVLLDLVDTGQKLQDRQGQHILIVLQFQKRVKKIKVSPHGLTLIGEPGEFGNLWVFRPWGVGRHKKGTVSRKLLQTIEGLCRLNLAWPTECTETFQVDSSSQNVRIRNEMKFEHLQDDWGTKFLAATAVPPVLMLAQSYGVPVKIVETVTDWGVPTKFGPFATVAGAVLDYSIPVPPLYEHAFFLVDGPSQKDWAKRINASARYQGALNSTTVDQAFRGIASMWPAREYLNPEKSETLNKASRLVSTMLQPSRLGKRFLWRMEPLSNQWYCFDYPGGHYVKERMHDMGWGNALVMYGLGKWSAYGGHWDELDRAWPDVWSLTEFFVKSHDWAWMTDSIGESGEGTAIDCLTASHAGLVAAVRMARTLNKPVDADQAAYLCAKTALSHTTRFGFLEYVQRHNLWHVDSPGIGTVNGFHEHNTWIHPRKSAPWWGVTSLSGFGVQPECFDAIFSYIGPPRLKAWWNMVESMYPEWFKKDKPYPAGTIYHGNSNYITTPVIYLQFRFGAKASQLMNWIRQAGISDGCDQNPNVYGEIANRDCPVQIAAWGRCTFDQARYESKRKQARVQFENPTAKKQEVLFRCKSIPAIITQDQKVLKPRITRDRWGSIIIRVDIHPGKHVVEFDFKRKS